MKIITIEERLQLGENRWKCIIQKQIIMIMKTMNNDEDIIFPKS